jgi:hypothetical protein
MNQREKILIILGAGVFTVVLLVLAWSRLFAAPAAEADARADALRKSNATLKTENTRLEQSVREWVRARNSTFDKDPLTTERLFNAWINDVVSEAGFGTTDLKLSKFVDRSLAHSYAGLGYTITTPKPVPLDRLVNLLYLLGRDPMLHRVFNLSVNPQRNGREVGFTLGCATLVLDEGVPAAPGLLAARPTSRPADTVSLESPDRAAYNVIARRNIFAIYTPPPKYTPQPPVAPPAAPVEVVRVPRPPTVDPNDMKVIGLPFNGQEAEIHLLSPTGAPESIHKPGDKLPPPGGEIVTVEYSPVPFSDKPEDTATSRMILKIGNDYWAVELGQRLSQKRMLKPEELPDELKPKPLADMTKAAPPVEK